MSPSPDVFGVLLAAGYARRFGNDKRRLPWPGGPTLLEAALHPLLANCGNTIVVLPPNDEWGRAICQQHGADVAWSLDRASGLAASLSTALPKVRHSAAIVVALADMGDVLPSSIAALIACWRKHPDSAVLPVYRGQAGNPRLIPASFYARLRALKGDDGVRHAIHWQQARRAYVDDPGVLRDVDTPEDLRHQELAGSDLGCNVLGAFKNCPTTDMIQLSCHPGSTTSPCTPDHSEHT